MICVGFAVVISIILFPLSAVMMRLFSSSQEVIDAGVAYLHTVLPFYFLLAIVFMYNSILRGTGEMMVPMISSFLALWLARLPAAYLLAYFFGKEAIFYSYGIGWLIGGIISACLLLFRPLEGKKRCPAYGENIIRYRFNNGYAIIPITPAPPMMSRESFFVFSEESGKLRKAL